MKMGEEAKDDPISQQHLQVACTRSSSVLNHDDEVGDDDNSRRTSEYHRKLSALKLLDNTSNIGSGTRTPNSRSQDQRSNFRRLIPIPVDKKGRLVRRQFISALRRTSPAELPEVVELGHYQKNKEFVSKFVEASYVRNAFSQSLATLPGASPLSNSQSSETNTRTSSSSENNAKFPLSGISENKRTLRFLKVPDPKKIPRERPTCDNNEWVRFLKSKAMNSREPNHLVQVTFDNRKKLETNRLFLNKQKRTRGRSPNKSSAISPPVDETSGPEDNPKSSLANLATNNISAKVVTDNCNNLDTRPTDSAQPVSDTQSKSDRVNTSQMRGRSLEKEKQGQSSKDESNNHSRTPQRNNNHAAQPPTANLGEEKSTPVTDSSLKKDPLEKKSGAVAAAVSNKNSNDTPKQHKYTFISSDSLRQALNFQCMISLSENTDSCSSTSTSASTSSSNEVSIVRSSGRSQTPSPVVINNKVNFSTSNNANSSSPSTSDTNASSSSNHGNTKPNKKLSTGPKAPKKYSEKMKAEASVVQRISELQKEGMWWERRLPKVYEPPRVKAHWDYLLEEMTWMAADFMNERKWKRNAAKKCARMIEKYFHDKELKRQRAEKDEEARKRRTAGTIAKMIRQFWANVQTVVEYKEQTIIESMRKKALDQKLSYLVNETEKYSEIVAQTFTAIAKKAGIENGIENGKEGDTGSVSSSQSKLGQSQSTSASLQDEVSSSPMPPGEDDAEFVPPSDEESDVDDTIAEQEAREVSEAPDHRNELDDLEAENNMSYDEIVAKYAKFLQNPEAFSEPTHPPEPERKKQPEPERRVTRGSLATRSSMRTRRQEALRAVESDIETDVDELSSSSTEESDEEVGSDVEKTNDLASLLKSISTSEEDLRKNTEAETNKLADLAESFKPTGYTLSSTTVVTKVPHILRHQLREYQHIGLDWLVTMYDKRLNGILADEMGLGKTIQTIALLAYLAVDRGNWGPHLVIVPTSVMLNWEMEFKKWCPGFKILTYYGSQKERKLKRSGWTKPNAFHVCITSYKLVIQDHQSFRRKRWKYLILDEAQNIKNFKSQRWQLLLNFHSQRRLLLTGTPLQNNLMELWSLLHFLMPNVFQSHMEFKDWFSTPMSGMVEGSQEYNEDIVRRLHKVLRPFILRRMKSEVEKQLPQKYEHVVMCSLSKRQRYLYEEFMSRTRTKETLSQGNLLSVINILMQLRKVCNHPNLFEPRPIVSPFQTEGIDCNLPSCVWDLFRDVNEDSFRQYFPLYTITNPKFSYSEDDATRIGELTPLFAYNPDEERRYVVMNYQQCDDTRQPPAKRVRRIVNLVKNEPPPCPRLQRPLTFFMSKGKPDRALEDPEFVDYLRKDAEAKQAAYKASKEDRPKRTSINNKVANATKTTGIKKDVPEASKSRETETENEDESSSESETEFVVVRKRKTAVKRMDISTRLQMMGSTVPDFNLDYIQERKLQDRKLVVNSLNKVNWQRCRVHTFVNQRLVENCRAVGHLPSLRLTNRKDGFGASVLNLENPRDHANEGYFHLGFNEIMKIIRIRDENVGLFDHPLVMWSTTSHLNSLIPTPKSTLSGLMNILTRYVMYIPAVSAPALECHMYRPATSTRYFTHLQQLDDIRMQFSKPTEVVHPVITRMLTQFPDPRLIQYDCGKLQTLDRLLRRLKTETHRVLIFTQMAKVLDILEAFLNYHGHTYLRLDGATKIDQRQMLMERFNADKKIFCFILSTRSGGIGVNLTGADTVIFYDSDWNPTMDAQAQDRCHRIGQTRDVHIYRLVSEKTVEENILKKSNQKRLLGELAIEGGKFTTTFFKQNTIRELFTINEKDDAAKRLSVWNTPAGPGSRSPAREEEEEPTFNPSDLMRSPEKKHEMQMIECALAAAEDDTDVQAAQTVHAEAEAEMAEFDENVSLDALDDVRTGPNRFEIEFQQVFEQLTDVERYALKVMESTIDDWSKETVAQAQKDLEEQKMAWELQQQKSVQEARMDIDDSSCATEDLLTYSNVESSNQVWVAQVGNVEQEMLFPVYQPPTPPHDEMDVYFDVTHGYLYDYDIMTEAQLPPVYVPKHPKKQAAPASPAPKPQTSTEKAPEPSKETVPETTELDADSSPTKKSPKVGRREDPIFAPKSLFDRPTPAMAKLRRDFRLQRYSCRPTSSTPKTTLGPGSITFPIVAPSTTQKTPAPPAPADSPDWLIAEDYSLLQTVRNVMEIPLNLLIVNLAQTPNWDYAQDSVNGVGLYYRTYKQCKWRYENVVAPREEGKLMFDTPTTSDPSSPSSGKKKKAKAFIKITPPSPSKAARIVKVSQLLSQDNNAQFRSIFCSKFDTIKNIAIKRAPTNKPVSHNPQVKSNKHIQAIAELGVNFDNPLSATSIAQARIERIQLERRKLELVRQQQAVAAAASAASGTPQATTPIAGVPPQLSVATYQGAVPVQGSPALLTVGLQNIMKVQQSPTGSVATLVKPPTAQSPQPTTAGAMSFPLHVSKLPPKSISPVTSVASPTPQQTVQTLGVQQLIMQRRPQPDQPQHLPPQTVQQQPPPQLPISAQTSVASAGKIAHIATQNIMKVQQSPAGSVATLVKPPIVQNSQPTTAPALSFPLHVSKLPPKSISPVTSVASPTPQQTVQTLGVQQLIMQRRQQTDQIQHLAPQQTVQQQPPPPPLPNPTQASVASGGKISHIAPQNIMKVQQSPVASVATLVKPPAAQPSQSTTAGAMSFPLHVSKLPPKSISPVTSVASPTQQQTVQALGVQQLMMQQRRQQQDQVQLPSPQHTLQQPPPPLPTSTQTSVAPGGKITHIATQYIMKVQQSPGGSVATLVKPSAAQTAQPTTAGALTFPLHVSKLPPKSISPVTSVASPTQQALGVQQLMIQRRPQPDQVQQPPLPQQSVQQQPPPQFPTPTSVASGGKITHIATQVNPPGTIPTHVVVQKQLPSTIAMQQLRQVFKQVGATGQMIGQGGQVLQAQMLGKPIAVSGTQNITVTTSGTTSTSALTLPPSATSTASLVHIPTGSSPIHARIVPVSVNLGSQQPGGVKQTIQIVSGHPPPNAAIIGAGPLAVRPPPPVVSTSNVPPPPPVNSIHIKIPTSSSSGNP